MTAEEQRALQRVLSELPTDADLLPPDQRLRAFLPLAEHARALHDRVIVVRGERGAGKTTLFLMLREAQQRGISVGDLIGDHRVPVGRWIEGFSENGTSHPMSDVLRELGDQHPDAVIRAFWLGYLAGVLSDHGALDLPEPFQSTWTQHRNDPARWVDVARLSLGPLSQALDVAEQRLAARSERIFVTYDHLDRIPLSDPGRRQQYASVLVDLWLTLANRYRHLRPKIFLREDLYQGLLGGWPDASKIESRSARLRWDHAEIFRLIARHLAADERLRGWLDQHTSTRLVEDPNLGWLPVTGFADEGERRNLMSALAREFMGSGSNKGYTHRWIVAKPADAHGVVMPRTVLTVLAEAARYALRANPPNPPSLLDHIALRHGLASAAKGRLRELVEEYPDVDRLKALRKAYMPMDAGEFTARLDPDGAAVVDRLIDIGVVIRYGEDPKRLDMPELYRLAFDVVHKGGTQRA